MSRKGYTIYNGRLIGSRIWSIECAIFNDLEWPLTNMSRVPYDINRRWMSQRRYVIDAWLQQTTHTQCYVVYWIMPPPMTLNDLEGHVILQNGFIVHLSNIHHIIMYEVNDNGRTSYVNNYFCCRIQPDGILYDTERDLLAIAKFLVTPRIRIGYVHDTASWI